MFSYKWLLFGLLILYEFPPSQSQEQDCNQILHFVKSYKMIITEIPRLTYPVSKICSNETVYAQIMDATSMYQNATTDKTCAAQLQNNRMNWIKLLYDQMMYIWQSANCQDCVDHRNETSQFFSHWKNLTQCMQEYKSNSTALCNACNGNYSVVQNYYEGLPSVKNRQVCFDIEDQMNQTRRDWSAKYGCCKDKQHSKTAFIWYAVGISSLPVMFYATMCIVMLRKARREQALSPPLLDDSNVSNESQPVSTPSTSEPGSSRDVRTNGIVIRKAPSEEKLDNLNNLDKIGPREGKLLDLTADSDSQYEFNPAKSNRTENDEDDVSILDAMKGDERTINLLE